MVQSPITLEALHILDAIDRRGSFAAAANELNRAPSSLSYQIQKLEMDLDIMIFDRSGHRAVFTQAGQILLEQGRVVLAATEKMVNDASLIANGWELDLSIACDGIIEVRHLYPMLKALGDICNTRVRLREEVLAGSWEALQTGRADLLVCPRSDLKNDIVPHDVKTHLLGRMGLIWVAAADHYVHKRRGDFDEQAREKYRVIVLADTAQVQPALSVNILQKQPRLTVSSLEAKMQAIVDGIGIGTLPLSLAHRLIAEGKLKQIAGSEIQEMEVIVAWKRTTMGEAKSWCIKYLKETWCYDQLMG